MISSTESDKIIKSLDCHLNISYGPTQRQKLDIYGDFLPQSAPLYVFIHGGYWQQLTKELSAYCGTKVRVLQLSRSIKKSFHIKYFPSQPLVEKGVRVIIIDYDLCPQVTLEELVDEIKVCFKWIAEYVNRNMIKSLSIAGHSAGGHLMACGLTEEFVNSIDDVKLSNYFISGVYYLNELMHLNAANENNILSLNEDNWKKLSPLYYDYSHLKSDMIKNFVFAGAEESKKFQEHSTKFATEILKGTNVELKIMEKMDHFEIVEKLTESDYEIIKIIIENI